MNTIGIVQCLLAFGFLSVGTLGVWGLGITGLLFLVPGAIFAGTAALTQTGSRAGILVTLVVDLILAYISWHRLATLIDNRVAASKMAHVVTLSATPRLADYLLPTVAIALVAVGIIGVLLDWRTVRRSPWF